MNNIYVLNKNYRQIGVLSNQGANPQAPYYDDLYIQELDTGADTYQFSTMSTSYTQDLLEIGNHIMFTYNNRNELFTITSLEYSHYEGYKTIGVYAEGIGFELLDVFMERPELPEEDEEGNKKYPNNIYIDENGNIIYDPEGNYEEDEDKITIDENGNIIYNPSTNKKKNNDSLEFKNISYPRFLSMLLKNTGWSYVCQPGLESVKHNISVRYDTNIYAILQDSMQAYRGVELEFVHEMQNGRVKKVVKAYKDGGRGSFVGKRFEYGTNVRGITKTQEVTNNEDDTIIRIDNVGVDIYYDIDFALKSAEIPEIEIGDTHYVIDRQFRPPMTIKARIGKIEVSFSDPTKNKITVANNKKIRGSAIEEDDIRDIIDDYISDDDYIPDDGIIDDGTGDDGTGDDGTGDDTYVPGIDVEELSTIELHSALLTVPLDEAASGSELVDDQNTSLYPALGFGKKQVLEFLMNDIEVCRYTHEDVVGKYWRAGIKDYPVYLDIKPNIEFSNNPLYFHRDKNSDGYDRWSDCEWRSDVASAIVIKDTEDINGDGDEVDEGEHMTHSYNLPSLVAAVIAAFQYHIDYHPDGSTDEEIDLSDYVTKAYLSSYATISYVDNAIAAIEPPGSSGYATEGYVDQKVNYMENYVNNSHNNLNDVIISKTKEIDDKLEEHIKNCTSNDNSSSGGDSGSNGGSGLGLPDGVIVYSNEEDPSGEYDPPFLCLNKANVKVENSLIVGGMVYTPSIWTDDFYTDTVKCDRITKGAQGTSTPLVFDCDVKFNGNVTGGNFSGGSSGSNNSSTLDTLTVRKIKGPAVDEGQYNCVEFEDAIRVNNIWATEGSSHVDFQDTLVIHGDLSVHAGIDMNGTEIDSVDYIKFKDGTVMTSAIPGGSISDGNIATVDVLYCYGIRSRDATSPIALGTSTITGDFYVNGATTIGGTTTINSNLYVHGTVNHSGLNLNSDKSKKENIRYLDASSNNESNILVHKANLETRDYSNEDLLEKADLYDFIVNQVNLCEYNFIGNDKNQIGFIANEYEGTKVGDKIVSRQGENDTLAYDVNNLLFATIGALQEEVRMRDEKIASLEARLAAIEEMLNNK